MSDPLTKANPEEWKKKAIDLTERIDVIIQDYNDILSQWEDVRDEAGESGKHEIDEIFTELSNAREHLCSLSGGSRRKGRSQRKQRRSRKQRR
jgi:hypothetical protein